MVVKTNNLHRRNLICMCYLTVIQFHFWRIWLHGLCLMMFKNNFTREGVQFIQLQDSPQVSRLLVHKYQDYQSTRIRTISPQVSRLSVLKYQDYQSTSIRTIKTISPQVSGLSVHKYQDYLSTSIRTISPQVSVHKY